MGSADRADSACLLWPAHDGGAARDERGHDDRCRGARRRRRDQRQGVRLGGLFGHGCGWKAGGAALFPYASAHGFPWFVADWGTLTVNPLASKGCELKRGDVLDFAVRFVVHDGDAGEADVAGLYGSFVAVGLE